MTILTQGNIFTCFALWHESLLISTGFCSSKLVVFSYPRRILVSQSCCFVFFVFQVFPQLYLGDLRFCPMISLSVPKLVGPRAQFDVSIRNTMAALGKVSAASSLQIQLDSHGPIIPGLPDDVAKRCLALLPRSDFPLVAAVCKTWRSFIQSKEFLAIRKQGNKLEEWMFVLTSDAERSERRWEVWAASGQKLKVLPPMPGPVKTGFAVALLESKFVVAGGYVAVVDGGSNNVSGDVYQYDSRINRCSIFRLLSWFMSRSVCDTEQT